MTALSHFGPEDKERKRWAFDCYVCDVATDGTYEDTRAFMIDHQHDRLLLARFNLFHGLPLGLETACWLVEEVKRLRAQLDGFLKDPFA